MEQELLFIGIDVDDQAYHTHLVSKQGTEFNFICRPNAGVLIKKLKGYKDRGFELKICKVNLPSAKGRCKPGTVGKLI